MLHEFAARGSIARTAEALGYTQSAVSQQLATLGIRVFGAVVSGMPVKTYGKTFAPPATTSAAAA